MFSSIFLCFETKKSCQHLFKASVCLKFFFLLMNMGWQGQGQLRLKFRNVYLIRNVCLPDLRCPWVFCKNTQVICRYIWKHCIFKKSTFLCFKSGTTNRLSITMTIPNLNGWHIFYSFAPLFILNGFSTTIDSGSHRISNISSQALWIQNKLRAHFLHLVVYFGRQLYRLRRQKEKERKELPKAFFWLFWVKVVVTVDESEQPV